MPDVVDLLREIGSEPVGSGGGGADTAVTAEPGRQRAPKKRRRGDRTVRNVESSTRLPSRGKDGKAPRGLYPRWAVILTA